MGLQKKSGIILAEIPIFETVGFFLLIIRGETWQDGGFVVGIGIGIREWLECGGFEIGGRRAWEGTVWYRDWGGKYTAASKPFFIVTVGVEDYVCSQMIAVGVLVVDLSATR